MPEDIKKVTDKQQETTPGIMVSGGEITANDFDEVSWEDLRKDYDNMIKDTPAISSSLNLLFYPIEASKFRIDIGESKSEIAKEARDYADFCFNNLQRDFNYTLKHDLLALPLGLMLQERIIKKGDEYKYIKDGKAKKKLTNRVIKYSPIQNETIQKFHYNEVGDFAGITHEKRVSDVEGKSTIDLVELYEGKNGIKNINDLFSIYTYRELFNDVRGNSILRPARLYWTCLKKVVIGRTVNIQRGAGIVMGKYNSRPSSADTKKFENMAKNLNSLHGDNFFWYDGSGLEVLLSELKGQQEVMAFVEFLYKQILMTLLTEFISIGMGQVGAYNAGETQKSPYEMSINNLLEDLKRHYQKELEFNMNIGYLSGLPKEDMPRFEFNAPSQTDLLKTSQILVNFKNTGINFTPEEINIIKGLLPFIPEKAIEVQDKKTLQPEEDQIVKENVEDFKLELKRNIKPEILEFETATIDKQDIEDHYLSVEEKADNIILKAIKEILKELKSQFENGAQRAHIGNWHAKDLEEKLYKLRMLGYNKGQNDVKKEIKKVQAFKILKIKHESLELAAGESKQKKVLALSIQKLLSDIKSSIDYEMTAMSDKQLNAIGGLDGYFSSKVDQFKGDKRNIIVDVTTGYTEGRNDKINEVSTEDTELLYSGILDKNFCDQCAQYDGLTYTKKEINESGNLTLDGNSINLSCLGLLGNNKCRCSWIIYG